MNTTFFTSADVNKNWIDVKMFIFSPLSFYTTDRGVKISNFTSELSIPTWRSCNTSYSHHFRGGVCSMWCILMKENIFPWKLRLFNENDWTLLYLPQLKPNTPQVYRNDFLLLRALTCFQFGTHQWIYSNFPILFIKIIALHPIEACLPLTDRDGKLKIKITAPR